ncbi:MAG: hypothetical protein HRU15_03045 [Planctomycetes bacterium]|nr:hypothetical protein [Planctomycetota bacterium]
MTPEIFFSVLIIGILAFAFLFHKPMKARLVRKVAKAFVDVFCAHCAKQHTYQRGAYAIEQDESKAFYEKRQLALEASGCRHIGDSENISMRTVLPGGGMFQKHFVNGAEDTSFSLTHLFAKQGKRSELIHALSATTYFNTGTVISSIASSNDPRNTSENIPTQLMINYVSFEVSVDDFLQKHQREVNLYLDNRENSQCERCHDMESVLRLANDKQKLLHDHIWSQGDPISIQHLRANLDPRMHYLITDIKIEVDRLLVEREESSL